jgi:hypothetical protein
MPIDIKFVLLVFAIIFLVVLLVGKAVKKVRKDRLTAIPPSKKTSPIQEKVLTEEQFQKTWKSLSYLLLVAAAGSLYMVYTAVKSALDPQMASVAIIYWIDAVFSLAAAVIAFFIWKKKTKTMVIVYFLFTLIPILMFMSIKGTPFKISALIHLFPLVLLYFVLKPVWSNLEN